MTCRAPRVAGGAPRIAGRRQVANSARAPRLPPVARRGSCATRRYFAVPSSGTVTIPTRHHLQGVVRYSELLEEWTADLPRAKRPKAKRAKSELVEMSAAEIANYRKTVEASDIDLEEMRVSWANTTGRAEGAFTPPPSTTIRTAQLSTTAKPPPPPNTRPAPPRTRTAAAPPLTPPHRIAAGPTLGVDDHRAARTKRGGRVTE